MKRHDVSLENIKTHGKVNAEYVDHILHVTTHLQNNRFHVSEMPLVSYICIPGKFKLPLKIDIRVKMDSPSMYVVLGKGHLTFGTSFLDNRRIGDIIEPDIKKTSAFDNSMEANIPYDISIMYGLKFLQVNINGKERYFSKKEKYIKSPLLNQLNQEGFELKIAGSKQNCLSISSIVVTEFDCDELSNPHPIENTENYAKINLSVDKTAKSDFEECISKLSEELQTETRELNQYLLGNKMLKIKRKIEGTSEACKISYVSSHGFTYGIHISDSIADHFFWWYMVSNNRYQDKYMGRKNDFTIETLNKVKDVSPDIADQLFSYYDECFGCNINCSARTVYEFAGNKKTVCHGKMIMTMKIETFKNLHFLFQALTDILA